MTQLSRGKRRGAVFSVRISDEEREALEALQSLGDGPRALGPWLVWSALAGSSPSHAKRLGQYQLEAPGIAGAGVREHSDAVPIAERVILDLCGGSGAWSRPYVDAGYDVRVVDVGLGFGECADVRTFAPPDNVWGIVAAPPCTEFSIARNGHPDIERDWVEGMACVNACMRIALQCRPRWWALENPTGHLSKFLGTPRDVWQPCDFGDPWTKQTAIWGNFEIPKRGPFVEPTTSAHKRSTAAARAITPPGFARAFFEANP